MAALPVRQGQAVQQAFLLETGRSTGQRRRFDAIGCDLRIGGELTVTNRAIQAGLTTQQLGGVVDKLEESSDRNF